MFLALVLSGYWLLARRKMLRLLIVVVASCLFYMAWQPAYILLLLTSITLDYTAGLGMARRAQPAQQARVVARELVGTLGLLGTFKCDNFVSHGGRAVAVWHVHPLHLSVLLPVGISFYTFQSLSYTIDVYRGAAEPRAIWSSSRSFVAFFPQLVAGPIVRAADLLPQLERSAALDAASASATALFLIATGLIKKIALADTLAAPRRSRRSTTHRRTRRSRCCSALLRATRCRSTATSPATPTSRSARRCCSASRLPENFDTPYLAAQPRGVLAALAHHAVDLAARLPLHPARRQSRAAGAHVSST